MKLAQALGYKTDNEFELLPKMALTTPIIKALPMDSWKEPDLAMPS